MMLRFTFFAGFERDHSTHEETISKERSLVIAIFSMISHVVAFEKTGIHNSFNLTPEFLISIVLSPSHWRVHRVQSPELGKM
jgi:hypothetical protein